MARAADGAAAAPDGAHVVAGWPPDEAARESALEALEPGGVVVLARRRFELGWDETMLITGPVSDGRSKNVSYDPGSGRLGGAAIQGEPRAALKTLMARFSDWATATVHTLAPAYSRALQTGKASFRPNEIEGRALSPRKDDRRLHVDAFPAQPVQGRRILRLFVNIDPGGAARTWRTGEPFETFAARFVGKIAPRPPGYDALLQAVRLTKGRRTAYDHAMLRLHDLAKADDDYQRDGVRHAPSFPAEATWLVFTDATPHAALSGKNALEQTFFLPVDAMARQEQSPLRVLERMMGKSLA